MKDKENLYIFLHIPKTAGSTFISHLMRNFNQDEIIHLFVGTKFLNLRKKRYGYFNNSKNIDEYLSSLTKDIDIYLSSLTENQKDKIKIICGHEVYYGIHKHFNKNPVYITFIRDPRERMVSAYNYNKTLINLPEDEFNALKLKPHPRFSKEINNRIMGKNPKPFPNFEPWTEKRLKEIHMIRFLKEARFIVTSKGKITKKEINEALDKFYFIGITENFDEDALFLYNKLGISKFCENKNVSKKFARFRNYRFFLEKIIKKSDLSYQFYNLALKKNRDFKKRNPSFYIIVNYMRVKRMIYNLGWRK